MSLIIQLRENDPQVLLMFYCVYSQNLHSLPKYLSSCSFKRESNLTLGGGGDGGGGYQKLNYERQDLAYFALHFILLWHNSKLNRKSSNQSFFDSYPYVYFFQRNGAAFLYMLNKGYGDIGFILLGQCWGDLELAKEDHSFGTYAKFFKKRFLPPDTHTYVFVSGGKKC